MLRESHESISRDIRALSCGTNLVPERDPEGPPRTHPLRILRRTDPRSRAEEGSNPDHFSFGAVGPRHAPTGPALGSLQGPLPPLPARESCLGRGGGKAGRRAGGLPGSSQAGSWTLASRLAHRPPPGCLGLLAPEVPGLGRVITVEALMNWGPVIKAPIDFLLRSSL